VTPARTETDRALKLVSYLDRLSEPTPAVLWLERAAKQLREQERVSPTGDVL
jgi:hypothetical protein